MKLYVVIVQRSRGNSSDKQIHLITDDLRFATEEALRKERRNKGFKDNGWEPTDVPMMWQNGDDFVSIEIHNLVTGDNYSNCINSG